MSIKANSGMTLLELLVVMVLLAVVSTLLMQGLSTGLATYERVQRRQYEDMPYKLASGWFIESVAGMEAQLDVPRQFKGSSQQISGISHSPLIGNNGMALPISWAITALENGNIALEYRQPGSTWQLLEWPRGSKVRFLFRDSNGNAQTQWPKASELSNVTPDGEMPSAVLLEVTPPDSPIDRWYVYMLGRGRPRSDYRDF